MFLQLPRYIYRFVWCILLISAINFLLVTQASAGLNIERFLENIQDKKSITFELAWINKHWQDLSPDQKSRLASYYLPSSQVHTGIDPFLQKHGLFKSSSTCQYNTEHFRVVWGGDYQDYFSDSFKNTSDYIIMWSDTDGDGYPRYIELLLGSDPYDAQEPDYGHGQGVLEKVHQEVSQMDFDSPANEGKKIEIYISNTGIKKSATQYYQSDKGIALPSNIYGVTSKFQDGATYIILNNLLDENNIKSIVAHEFFHAVQSGYTSFSSLWNDDMAKWLAESSATWMESVVYPQNSDYVQYVDSFVQDPQKTLFTTSGNRHYQGVLFLKYLNQYYHNQQGTKENTVIRKIWENTKKMKPLAAMEQFLDNQKVRPEIDSLAAAYTDFALKNVDIKANYQAGKDYQSVNCHEYEFSVAQDLGIHEEITESGQIPQNYGASYVDLHMDKNKLDQLGKVLNRLSISLQKKNVPDQSTLKSFVLMQEPNGTWHGPFELTAGQETQMQYTKKGQSIFSKAYLITVLTPDSATEWQVQSASYSFFADAYCGIFIQPGWNLLALDQQQDFLLSDKTDVKSVWQWSSKDASWKTYLGGDYSKNQSQNYLQKKGFLPLNTLSNPYGAWVNLKGQDTIEVNAFPESGNSVQLYPGWNLVGNISEQIIYKEEIGNTIDFKSIWKWDVQTNNWQVALKEIQGQDFKQYLQNKGYRPLNKIYFGEAFWVHAQAAQNLEMGKIQDN